MRQFKSVEVTYQVTYFVNGKPVVLLSRDEESFKGIVARLQDQFPLRKLYLSSRLVGKD